MASFADLPEMHLPIFPGDDFWQFSKTYHKGKYLPHFSMKNAVYSIVLRSNGTIPVKLYQTLNEEIEQFEKLHEETNNEFFLTQLVRLWQERDDYCFKRRDSIQLNTPDTGQTIIDVLNECNGAFFFLHTFCIMFTHIHLLLELLPDISLEYAMKVLKQRVGFRINQLLHRTRSVLASDFFNRVIRTRPSYYLHSQYIWYNPGNLEFYKYRGSVLYGTPMLVSNFNNRFPVDSNGIITGYELRQDEVWHPVYNGGNSNGNAYFGIKPQGL